MTTVHKFPFLFFFVAYAIPTRFDARQTNWKYMKSGNKRDEKVYLNLEDKESSHILILIHELLRRTTALSTVAVDIGYGRKSHHQPDIALIWYIFKFKCRYFKCFCSKYYLIYSSSGSNRINMVSWLGSVCVWNKVAAWNLRALNILGVNQTNKIDSFG